MKHGTWDTNCYEQKETLSHGELKTDIILLGRKLRMTCSYDAIVRTVCVRDVFGQDQDKNNSNLLTSFLISLTITRSQSSSHK